MSEDAVQRLAGDEAVPLDAADLKAGGYVAIAMFAAGGALLPVAVLIHEMVDLAEVVVIGIASLALAGAFVVLTHSGRLTVTRLYLADYAWIGLTAALVASSGGASSPFFLLYPLPVLHAAAFQSAWRLVAVATVAVLAFLTPFVYDAASDALFGAMAIIAVPPTLVVAWSLNVTLTTLRRQRRTLIAAERDAAQLARSDSLTGLGNFRLLWQALDAEVSRARRYGEPFTLILLDLDGFKAINDELGHPTGDLALQRAGAALAGQLRAEDICCRHGGDEFSVVAARAGSAEAARLAQRLVEAVREVRIGPRGERRLGATAGWATFADPATSAEDLMRAADRVLLDRKYGAAPAAYADGTAAAGEPPLTRLAALGRRLRMPGSRRP